MIGEKLIEILGEDRVRRQEALSGHTTFRIGGPADYFVLPETAEQIGQVIRECKEEGLPYYILGNGSNVLASDNGYRGVVIQVFKNMDRIILAGEKITAQAGALMSRLGAESLAASLTGMEFGAGIPGTLGGAVVMNAGAYGGEMKDILASATVLTQEGEIISIPGNEMEMGYRTSLVKKKGYIVLAAELQLAAGDKEKIKERMDDLKQRREDKQPLAYPSAGSTFKRPEGYFAGKLIMDAGLRGYQVGGAMISEKHCGFVINVGDATSAHVIQLMKDVREKVYAACGVMLEPEVRLLGEFSEDFLED